MAVKSVTYKCIDDADYIAAANSAQKWATAAAALDISVMVALALWKRKANSAISDMQEELGKRQLKLAQNLREHLKKYWPYEDDFLADAFGEGRATRQYSALSTSWGSFADSSFEKANQAINYELKRRCITLSKCEQQVMKNMNQLARSDIMSHADRQAEMREITTNQKRFNRQYAALALGRDMLANVPSFQEVAGMQARAISSVFNPNNISELIGTGINWLQRQNKPDPKYDYMPQPTSEHYNGSNQKDRTESGVSK